MFTLDGRQLTFNNLGEFTLMEAQGNTTDGVELNVTMQGRTCQAEAANGNLTLATVWCALAVKSFDTFTEINTKQSQSGKYYMVLYINKRDFTIAIQDTGAVSEVYGNIYLTKSENSTAFKLSTTDGLGLTVDQSGSVLEFTIETSDSFKNMTRGLMGNYNGDTSDDIMYPNGTILEGSILDREIFHYVWEWGIEEDESLFLYEGIRDFSYYNNRSFVPLFLDEANQTEIAAAELICGGSANQACIFDYIATGNEELAQRSAEAQRVFDETRTELSFSAPEVAGPESVNVINSTSVTLTFNVSSSDGAPVNVSFRGADSDAVSVVRQDSDRVEIAYKPASTVDSLSSITIVATNTNNSIETVTPVEVVYCTGCNGRGSCNFDRKREELSQYTAVATCVCETPFSGLDCEEDNDACLADPCPPLTTCTDVPWQEELNTSVSFTCSPCPAGFLMDDQYRCEDVDECRASNTSCPENSDCINNVGSFTCSCRSGYRMNSANLCEDEDECLELKHECNQICKNTAGSYDCACESGFTLGIMGFECSPDSLEPCQTERGNCSYGCRNENGIKVCFCEQGQVLDTDGLKCIDLDECEENVCAQKCNNTVGSYTCSCFSGFMLSADKQNCEVCPENRWGSDCENFCDCRGRANTCDNVYGCKCQPSWTGSSCEIDVDECATIPNICPEGQFCSNTNGSYECLCPTGYEDTYGNGTCFDVNECNFAEIHQCTQQCVNNPGSFACTCTAGYFFNPTTKDCEDINECTARIHGCDQDCENNPGSFSCACRLGYILGDDRKSCVEEFEVCTNATQCSHWCTVENNQEICICPDTMSLGSDGLTCIDINECESNTTNLCSDTCENTIGSYTCSCPAGKQISNDKRTCIACDNFHWGAECSTECACNPLGTSYCDRVFGCTCKAGWTGANCELDINECDSLTTSCPDLSTCINTDGSYQCQCLTGYQMDSTGNCTDIDECSLPTCDQDCTNTIGSFVCSCRSGFRKSGTGKCEDIDECRYPAANKCNQICRNQIGLYQCSCQPGFNLDLSDRATCIVDESSLCNATTTNCEHICSVVNDQPVCSCNAGFELDPSNNSSCKDIQECSANPSPCINGTCNDLDGGFSCNCSVGTYLLSDMITCAACEFGTYGEGCNQTCDCVTANSNGCDAATGTCVCLSGWEGANCSVNIDECSGVDAVDCGNYSTCRDDPGTYRCICDIGFYRSKTEGCQACSDVNYGVDCAERCHCNAAGTEDCDDRTGVCSCKPDWTGTNCDQCSVGFSLVNGNCVACDATHYGAGCAQECSCVAANTRDCNDTTGECACEVGWAGDVCNQCSADGFVNVDGACVACDDTHYGLNCSSECSCVAQNTLDCDNLSGTCRCTTNFTGDNCELCKDIGYTHVNGSCQPCDSSHYGQQCAEECQCVTSNTLECDNVNGTCTCADGWTGSRCDLCEDVGFTNVNGTCTACDATHYGLHCENNCTCVADNTIDCDNSNGTCTCSGLWKGPNCDRCPEKGYSKVNGTCQACDDTHYGGDCSQNCSCVAANTVDCDDVEGTCTCSGVWQGDNCDQCPPLGYSKVNGTCEACNSTHYGADCGSMCACVAASTRDCNDTTGECTCVEGFTGTVCDQCSATGYENINSVCVDIDECADFTADCSIYEDCANTNGSFTCACKSGFVRAGGACERQETTNGTDTFDRVFELILEIPGASDAILDTTALEFRNMSQRVSAVLMRFGRQSFGNRLLAVIIRRFTRGSFIANISAIVEGDGDSENAAANLASYLNNLLSADWSELSAGASLNGIDIGNTSLTNSNTLCEIFSSLYNCAEGFQCQESNGVVGCKLIDDDDKDWILGLGIGLGGFVVLAAVLTAVICLYKRRKESKRRNRELTSNSSEQRVFATGIAPRWSVSHASSEYGPTRFKDTGSSDSGSVRSGPSGSRYLRNVNLAGTSAPFKGTAGGGLNDSSWSGAGYSSFVRETPRLHDSDGKLRDREPKENSNSNFSWDLMFKALEFKNFEIQRPQVNPHSPQNGNT